MVEDNNEGWANSADAVTSAAPYGGCMVLISALLFSGSLSKLSQHTVILHNKTIK